MLVAALGNYSCKDSYDLDDEQPSGLNSIYGYMEEQGNFTYFLRLINDLGEKEVLSKTGSKTLFVADDAAFADFLKTNSWGVRDYKDLSLAQKKLLLYSAMIDNPYPTSMLSSAQGPVKGEVCRRASSQSVYDSVQVIYAKDYDTYLPKNSYFEDLVVNDGRDSIVLFNDGSGAPPMVHFNAQYLTGNKLESTDIDFLYNDAPGTRQSDDVYVNLSKVINDENHMNVFCKNGFLHVVDKVITPLENMATIISQDPNLSIYSAILDRFCVPMDSASLTTAYNQVKGLDTDHKVDNIFMKRYFAKRSIGSDDTNRSGLAADRYGNPAESQLKFDPGWNTYVAEVPNDRVPLMEDLAVMLAPSNEAIQKWWNKEGKVIQDYYAPGVTDAAEGLPNVPISVIAELVNVNMLNSFASSLPSRFDDVLNDANEPLGLVEDSVDNVTLGCNGAVYQTSCVYAPTSYSSVLFPAVVDTTNFKVIKKAIDLLEYDAYLNSMVSTYSFFLPTNNGLLSYVDPVSFGQTDQGQPAYQVWEFGLDPTVSSAKQITANVYKCILNEDGTWTKGAQVTTLKNISTSYDAAGGTVTVLSDRFLDMLDNIIVTEPLVEGKSYYKTKGNNYVKISGNLDVEHEMYVSGSWQTERNQPIKVGQIFDMRNGKAYILSDEDGTPDVLNGTAKSVSKCLSEMDECSDFFDMLQACGAVSTSNVKDSWTAGDQLYGNLLVYKADTKSVTYLLNAYQYTIYAPTNDAMQQAYAMGLPSLADLELAEAYDEEMAELKESTDSADHIKAVMLDFVKYHIQDNAIFVDNGFEDGNYESGKTELTPSVDGETGLPTGKYSPGRPYKINVQSSASGITVKDHANPDKEIHVVMKDGLYNVYAREYWYNGSSVSNPYSSTINNTSCAVIHAVDAPLLYNYTAGSTDPDENQFIYKDRTITKESSIKNRSPRKYVRR